MPDEQLAPHDPARVATSYSTRLVAVGVIAIIVGLGVWYLSKPSPATVPPLPDPRRALAEVQIRVICSAIDAHRLLRRGTEVPEGSELLHALFDPHAPGEPPLVDRDVFPAGRLVDPWGHDYVYIKHGPRSYEVISYGADHVPGGSDGAADISSKDLR